MTEDPWEVIRDSLEEHYVVRGGHRDNEKALAALTTLREQMAETARKRKRYYVERVRELREQVERQEAALDRIARMDTGITADAPLSEAPSIARRALSTGEPSSNVCPRCASLVRSHRRRCPDPWHGEPSEEPSHGYHEAGDYP